MLFIASFCYIVNHINSKLKEELKTAVLMRFVTTSKDPSYNYTCKRGYFELDFVDNFNYLGSYLATTENDVEKQQGQALDAFWR